MTKISKFFNPLLFKGNFITFLQLLDDWFYFLLVLLVGLMEVGKQSFGCTVRIVPDEFLWLVKLFGFQNHLWLPGILVWQYR